MPIHGIGNQGHLDTRYGWNPALLRQGLERYASLGLERYASLGLKRYASLGLKVAITEAGVRAFVNNATGQVPTDHLSAFAQPYEYSDLLKAALAVPECISFTVWGFTDSGYACIYDVNQKPKAACYSLQSDLALAAYGAPQRVHTYMPRA